MWVAHRPCFGKHAFSVLYFVHSVSVKGVQLLLHLQRFLTPPSLNPGVISLEISLLKTIKRLMSVSTMVAWKALFIPLLFNLWHVKDPESNRDSSAQPTRTPERSTHPYTWRWVDWNAWTRQTGEAVQAVPRSPASWLQWLSCSPREPSSRRGRGTCYSSLLATSEAVSTVSWAMQAAGPMTLVPPAGVPLSTPVPHHRHCWQHPQIQQPQMW